MQAKVQIGLVSRQNECQRFIWNQLKVLNMSRMGSKRHCSTAQHGFTLVELLVVIGIIALLISILLPSLNSARRQARMVVCQSNLRQFGVGLQLYVSENKGFIPGPNTSGLSLYKGGNFGGASDSPVQDWDWISPIMGRPMNMVKVQGTVTPATLETARLTKFRNLMDLKLRCPENYAISNHYSGPSLLGTGQPPIFSYTTPSFFHLLPGLSTAYTGENINGTQRFYIMPSGYVPKITKVGKSAEKIFAFEGARYWDPARNWFDYTTDTKTQGLAAAPQGSMHSRGPATFGGSGEPYEFESYVGNPGSLKPQKQYKAAALRHKGKLLAVYFDGHVGDLTFLDAANPNLWAPAGSKTGTDQNAVMINKLYGTIKIKAGTPIP